MNLILKKIGHQKVLYQAGRRMRLKYPLQPVDQFVRLKRYIAFGAGGSVTFYSVQISKSVATDNAWLIIQSLPGIFQLKVSSGRGIDFGKYKVYNIYG